MDPEDSLPYYQEPATSLYLESNVPSTFPLYFPGIHSDILSSMPTSSKWSLPFIFSNQNFVCISHISDVLHALPISSCFDYLINS